MPKFPYYKRYTDDALTGMRELDLQQRGAYITVLDLIYEKDGDLVDDDRFLAGYLGVDIRVWRRLKRKLIELDKIQIGDGRIRNRRADVVLAERLATTIRARYAGRSSGVSRRPKSAAESNGNKGLSRTTVPTKRERNSNYIEKEIEKPLLSPSTDSTGDQARRAHLESVAWRVRGRHVPYPPLDEIREAIDAGMLTGEEAWQAGVGDRPGDSPSEGQDEGLPSEGGGADEGLPSESESADER